jgi:two-component system, cell cycle response regulator CpdR
LSRILVVDDEEPIRSLVARALAQDGHEIVTADDGAEALDLITRQPGGFDLLVADIRMPVMDGIALALATARDHPDIIILLMTAYADQRERASGLDRLIHDVITKPFTLDAIRAAVAGALAAGAQRLR